MVRRGKELREHILLNAKDVFLEAGFERASMDAVAARARTSKRSLYAHYDSKERLFLEVIEFVRGLALARIGVPGGDADDPADALARFCGRYLETLLYQGSIRMCRVMMAEAARFPEGAAKFHDLMFAEVAARLCAYLAAALGIPEEAAAGLAERLLGRILYPRFPRALFGLDELPPRLDAETSSPCLDLAPVRAAVAEVLSALGRG